MDAAWGMSNSVFAFLFLVLVVSLRIGIGLFNLLARSARTRRDAASPETDRFQLAYLHGGVDRVADTVVAELVAAGVMRVDADGKLHATGAQVYHEYQQRALQRAGEGITMAEMRSDFRRSGIIRAQLARMRELGLISGARQMWILRVLVWMLGALTVIGLIRVADAAIRGYLAPEHILVLIGVFMWARTRRCGWEPKRTARGDRLVSRVRLTSTVPAGVSHAPRAYENPVDVATAVAVHGMAQYPDPFVAEQLSVPEPWWKRSVLGGGGDWSVVGDGDGGDGGDGGGGGD